MITLLSNVSGKACPQTFFFLFFDNSTVRERSEQARASAERGFWLGSTWCKTAQNVPRPTKYPAVRDRSLFIAGGGGGWRTILGEIT